MHAKLIQGIEVWNRHCEKYKNSNYFFILSKNRTMLALVNKQSLIAAIDNNLDLFRIYLKQPEITKEEVYDDVIQAIHQDFHQQYHCVLQGIIYGFGRNNALAFGKKCQFSPPLSKMEGSLQLSCVLRNKYSPDLSFIFPVGYMVLPNTINEAENRQVAFELQKAHDAIVGAVNESEDFLSIVLERFAKD